MGTWRSGLAGFMLSVSIRHLLAVTGVVSAQRFLKPDLVSDLHTQFHRSVSSSEGNCT